MVQIMLWLKTLDLIWWVAKKYLKALEHIVGYRYKFHHGDTWNSGGWSGVRKRAV